MGDLKFDSLKEAKPWLQGEAVDAAIEPLLAYLHPDAVDGLRDYLDDLLATHPVVRTQFTRAARLYVIPNFEPIREAARRAGEEEEEPEEGDDPSVPKAPRPHKLDPMLEGLPDLKRPEFHKVAFDVIKALAKHLCRKWRGKFDKEYISDLVGLGWTVAVEMAPKWDATKALFSTYLWHFVRCRLINYAKKFLNRFETPMSGIGAADLPKAREGEDAREALDRMLATGATSWMLASFQRPPETPEEKVARVVEREEVRAAIRTLDPDEQKIVALVYTEDMSCRQAATHLGISASTALRWHDVALAKLRSALAKSTNVRVLRPKPKNA